MKLSKNNSGTTMVELLVGFTLLMIIMTSIFKIIKVSTNMMYESADIKNDLSAFEAEYYKKNYGIKGNQEDFLKKTNVSSTESVNFSFVETDKDGRVKNNGLKLSIDDYELINIEIKNDINNLGISVFRFVKN